MRILQDIQNLVRFAHNWNNGTMECWDHWCSIWLKNNTVHGINKPWIEKTSNRLFLKMSARSWLNVNPKISQVKVFRFFRLASTQQDQTIPRPTISPKGFKIPRLSDLIELSNAPLAQPDRTNENKAESACLINLSHIHNDQD